MKINVLGKKKTDFTDEKGVNKKFYKLYAVHKVPFDDEITQYEGKACSELSVPVEIFDLVTIGKDYLADFDKNGKLLDKLSYLGN